MLNAHLKKIFILTWRFFLKIAFRERKGERNINEREKNQLVAFCTWSRDQTLNLGICPDWESN